MELMFNKPFLTNIFETFGYYINPVHRNLLVGGTGSNKNDKQEKVINVYSDALNTTTTVQVEPQFVTFCNQGFITILDKINTHVWNGNVLAANLNQMKLLVNTLIHGNDAQRSSALDKFVSMGIILASDITYSKLIVSSCLNFKPELVGTTFNEAENYYMYTYNNPVTLQKKYSQNRNPNKEKLYLLFVGRGHSNFGYSPATGEVFGHFASYWNEATLGTSLNIGYIAVDLGEINGDTPAAIKYDHLDVIEVIDDIKIQVNVPNQFIS